MSDEEILRDGKPVKKPNDPFTVLLAILAVWSIAFVMAARLRHRVASAVIFIIAIALTLVFYRANKKEK